MLPPSGKEAELGRAAGCLGDRVPNGYRQIPGGTTRRGRLCRGLAAAARKRAGRWTDIPIFARMSPKKRSEETCSPRFGSASAAGCGGEQCRGGFDESQPADSGGHLQPDHERQRAGRVSGIRGKARF